ncbi:hypothetical protein SELMODRAFT_268628 [Selaginella moellendorffii]|uniref:CTLH domain-containing protein n=1 Tax=Selaginella moellendorffii TaxID=88036 RepID=D8SHE6_SELML|nr:hypothetical protein SELMODRAFT_268628 [Selaginella moellendorffii]
MKLSSPHQDSRRQHHNLLAPFPLLSPRQSSSLYRSPKPHESLGMGPPIESQMMGSKKQIRRVEFVRIITQALYSLGYSRAAALVEEESGVPLQLPVVSDFRREVLDGRWEESVATLAKIGPLLDETHKLAAFLILQQKFLELLVDRGDVLGALRTLRTEISPLGLCRLSHPRGYLGESGVEGKRHEARMALLEKIQALLPPHIMIPERRLEHLVEQALAVQREGCIFHNSAETALSLYTDHQCGRDQIPTETVQVLEAHDNEVWYLQFSRDGRHLASASKDCTAIIWEVVDDDFVRRKHTLAGHHKSVSFVAWSPDDSMILTCGTEEAVKLWDTATGECKHTFQKASHGFTSCAWFPDGKTFVTGAADKCMYRWDLSGAELEVWKPRMPRIIDLAVTPDGSNVVCICHDKDIRVFNLEDKTERVIEEDHSITSLSVSLDGRYLLVNLVSQEIHLWDMALNSRSPCKYKGHRQGRYVIRSCFGGSDHAFIVSGSEDSQVYIWHRGNGELLEVLPGHSGTVNCVSWNPSNPHMFASASDDHTIRIWGLSATKRDRHRRSSAASPTPKSNGGISHIVNGGTRELLENLRPF